MSKEKWDPSGYPVAFVRTEEELAALDGALTRASRVAVDTETHAGILFRDGLWAALRVIAVAVKYPDGSYESFVVDVRDIPVKALARSMSLVKVADAWNANFDDRVLFLHGCPVAKWRDAMFTDGLLHCGSTGFGFWHGLAYSAKKFLGLDMGGKGTTQLSYDGENDLTKEQVDYPAMDALITLRLAEFLDARAVAKNLKVAVDLEQAARPFLLSMMEHGIPFDQEAWTREILSTHVSGKEKVLSELADLTGGPEETLFGTSAGPSWNPDSDPELREALNTFARDAVMKFTGGRLLTKADKLDKTSLKQIECPLTKAVLKYREHAKMLSTYGENLDKWVADDGRIRPRYQQGGVVATGRLASDSPNAQNFSPQMKPFFRPKSHELPDGTVVQRAIVYADLSQAELRVLAQVSNEERMRELFRMGGDFHARTAADMFQVDMDTLKDSDPAAFTNNRKKAKGVNFGIPYGLGAAALATNLTVNSKLHTSTDEAAAMLKRYGETYVAVQAWLAERDGFVRNLSRNPGQVDWDRTFKLFEAFRRIDPLKRSFKRANKRPASEPELAELYEPAETLRERLEVSLGHAPTVDELAEALALNVELITWVAGFDSPVVLTPSGNPWYFESRSETGRRRLFTVPVDSSTKDKFEGVLTSAVLSICTSDDPVIANIRAEFAKEYNLDLPVGVDRVARRTNEPDKIYKARCREEGKHERMGVIKTFEGDRKPLKYELVKFAARQHPDSSWVRGSLLPTCMGDQVRSMGNKYRNHPIQSLVADVGLQYYADLHERLKSYRAAYPVQAVHDSIAIECDLKDAVRLCVEVKAALENALHHWCPDVPAVADADVRLSLADDDVVSEEQINALLEDD